MAWHTARPAAAARGAYFAAMAQAEHDWIDSADQAAYDLALADLMTAFKGDQGDVDAQWDVDRSAAWKTYADAVYGDDEVAGPGAELVRSTAVSQATFDHDYGGAADYAAFQTSLANLDAAQRSGEAGSFKNALAAFAQSYQSPWAAKAAAEALARFNHESALAAAEAARKITAANADRKLAQAQATARKDKSDAEAQADADRIGAEAQAELDRATGLKAAVAANPSEANVERLEDRLPAGLVRVDLPGRITPTAESTYFGSPGGFTYRSPQDPGTDGYGGHVKERQYGEWSLARYNPDDVWDYGGYGGRAWWWMPPEDPEENPGPISELLRYMNVDHTWSDDTPGDPYGGPGISAWQLGAEPDVITVDGPEGYKTWTDPETGQWYYEAIPYVGEWVEGKSPSSAATRSSEDAPAPVGVPTQDGGDGKAREESGGVFGFADHFYKRKPENEILAEEIEKLLKQEKEGRDLWDRASAAAKKVYGKDLKIVVVDDLPGGTPAQFDPESGEIRLSKTLMGPGRKVKWVIPALLQELCNAARAEEFAALDKLAIGGNMNGRDEYAERKERIEYEGFKEMIMLIDKLRQRGSEWFGISIPRPYLPGGVPTWDFFLHNMQESGHFDLYREDYDGLIDSQPER